MKTKIQTVKGTRDFYPEDMAVRNWLYQVIREISVSFGYQEYEGPILETLELYAAKSGEELVKEQAFVFSDRGGDLITLRPELTPTLARMVAQRQQTLIFPLRWWSFGPFWRYERPQKGRTREFFQWNIDIIGANSPATDAELVTICATFLSKVGLGSNVVRIKVNHRGLMDKQLGKIGILPEKRAEIFRLIDRKDKLDPEAWNDLAIKLGLSSHQINAIDSLLLNKDLWKESEELQKFFEVLKANEMEDYVEFDPNIIRGLDYYTGIVFEAWEVHAGRAILGGGRYDNLLKEVGGDPLSGVGFAMGDVLITIILRENNLIPPINPFKNAVMVSVFSDEYLSHSLRLAKQLRDSGINVVCHPESLKLQKQLKYADRLGIRHVVILGPDEVHDGTIQIKDLETHDQKSYPISEGLRILHQFYNCSKRK